MFKTIKTYCKNVINIIPHLYRFLLILHKHSIEEVKQLFEMSDKQTHRFINFALRFWLIIYFILLFIIYPLLLFIIWNNVLTLFGLPTLSFTLSVAIVLLFNFILYFLKYENI